MTIFDWVGILFGIIGLIQSLVVMGFLMGHHLADKELRRKWSELIPEGWFPLVDVGMVLYFLFTFRWKKHPELYLFLFMGLLFISCGIWMYTLDTP
ncbi:MAG: hypothetical protein ACO3N7_02565 [Kiritimatiellia bacterium]